MTRSLEIEAVNEDEVLKKVRQELEQDLKNIDSLNQVKDLIIDINLIKEKRGFLGFGKKRNIYRVIIEDKINNSEIDIENNQLIEEIDVDGDFQLKITTEGIMVRINAPQGEGKPVRYQHIKLELERKKIEEVDWGIVQEAVDKANGEWIVIAPRKPELDRDAEIQLNISDDRMKVFIDYYPALGGQKLSFQDVKIKLEELGISYGVKENKLTGLIANREGCQKMLIAEGTPPVPGEDGKLIYHFEEKKETTGTEQEDGSIDFYNLGLINNVEPGDVVVTRKEPQPGQPGITVTGEEVLPPEPKTVKLPQGKNVKQKDENTLIAEIAGQVVKSNNQVSVFPVHKVKGDVDLSTGNIDFVGSVFVQGDVLEGFMIKAGGNVEVRGNVSGAVIKSKGEVVIHKGFIGKKKGKIEAKGDIRIKFVENGNIVTDQSIYVSDAVMHSNLQAIDTVEVTRRKGLIVGGNCQAGRKIVANIVGSNLATATKLELGVDPESRKSIQELKEKISQDQENLNKSNRAIMLLENLEKERRLSPEKKKMLSKLHNTRQRLQKSIKKSQDRYEKLKVKSKELSHNRIKICKKVFPGTSLVINGFQYKIQDELGPATFILEEGEIRQISV